jgi:hypothetical protein
MQDISSGIMRMSRSIDGITAEHKLYQLQQARQAPWATSPEHRHDTLDHLQEVEMYLDTQQMVVIVDLITRSTATADAYIALK